jgi:hypothetical protein
MPLDATSVQTVGQSRFSPVSDLSQTEREAAAHFAQLLRANLANMPETVCAMLLVVGLPTQLESASARLIPEADAAASMTSNETAIAAVLQGVPRPWAKRRALALRLASVAAATWRQRRQIERLGLIAI